MNPPVVELRVLLWNRPGRQHRAGWGRRRGASDRRRHRSGPGVGRRTAATGQRGARERTPGSGQRSMVGFARNSARKRPKRVTENPQEPAPGVFITFGDGVWQNV